MSISMVRKVIVSAVLFSAFAFAGDGKDCGSHDGHGAGMGEAGAPGCSNHQQMAMELDKELNLTTEQKTKLQAIREEGKTGRNEHMQKMKDLRLKMKEELSKDKPDGVKLMEYASLTSDLVEQQTKAHVEHLLKVKQILSKEQFEKMLSREGMAKGKNNCDRKDDCDRHNGKNCAK